MTLHKSVCDFRKRSSIGLREDGSFSSIHTLTHLINIMTPQQTSSLSIELHVTHIFSFRSHAWPHVQFLSSLVIHGRPFYAAASRFWVISFYLLKYVLLYADFSISLDFQDASLVDISILRESLQIPRSDHNLVQVIVWTPALYYNTIASYTFPLRCCNFICSLSDLWRSREEFACRWLFQ